MTTRTLTPTLAAPLGTRFLEAFFRFFSRSVVTRESVDQAWIDAGLGRLDASGRQDSDASPPSERARLAEAWKLASALDATRFL